MTQELALFARRRWITMKAVFAGVAAASAALCLDVSAQQSAVGGARSIEGGAVSRAQTLEQVFWQCDYASTQVVLDFGTAAYCSVVNEELKKTRFGGDYDAMHLWWQQNKATEHARFDTAPSGSNLR